jgi:hypothetical protein
MDDAIRCAWSGARRGNGPAAAAASGCSDLDHGATACSDPWRAAPTRRRWTAGPGLDGPGAADVDAASAAVVVGQRRARPDGATPAPASPRCGRGDRAGPLGHPVRCGRTTIAWRHGVLASTISARTLLAAVGRSAGSPPYGDGASLDRWTRPMARSRPRPHGFGLAPRSGEGESGSNCLPAARGGEPVEDATALGATTQRKRRVPDRRPRPGARDRPSRVVAGRGAPRAAAALAPTSRRSSRCNRRRRVLPARSRRDRSGAAGGIGRRGRIAARRVRPAMVVIGDPAGGRRSRMVETEEHRRTQKTPAAPAPWTLRACCSASARPARSPARRCRPLRSRLAWRSRRTRCHGPRPMSPGPTAHRHAIGQLARSPLANERKIDHGREACPSSGRR